jgi:zinc D-Ala-D-Ala carboxypeptidase
MNIKHILALLAFGLVIIGGPAYVLFVKDPPKVEQTKTEAKQETPTQKEQPKPAEVPSFDKAKYSHDDPTSIWVVSNKQRPLSPKNYAPTDLVAVGGGQQLRKEAADNLATLLSASRSAGLSINPLSGYRSYNTQVSVYNNEVRTNGQTVADTQSARPGHSEHQTGLAIDVGGGGCGIEDCFGNTPAGKWLAANAHSYGFIIRYPESKQDITGYRYEPWHIRYIGTELATEMNKKGVQTLEEFFGLPAAPNYQ